MVRNWIPVLALLVWGCSDAPESEPVDMAEKSAVEPRHGGQMAEPPTLAKNEFPPDFPAHPSAEISEFAYEMGEGVTLKATVKIDEAAEQVSRFYRYEMESQGWKLNASEKIPGLDLLSFTKPGRATSLTIEPVDGVTQVEVEMFW